MDRPGSYEAYEASARGPERSTWSSIIRRHGLDGTLVFYHDYWGRAGRGQMPAWSPGLRLTRRRCQLGGGYGGSLVRDVMEKTASPEGWWATWT